MSNAAARTSEDIVSLAGTWSCRLDPEHRGLAEAWQNTSIDEYTVALPGTTQTNGIGAPYTTRLISNLTPLTNHVGPAWYQREFFLTWDQCANHVELFLERCCWQSFAWLNGVALGSRDSLVAPHEYDLSPAVQPGENRLTVMMDNANLEHPGQTRFEDGSEHVDLKLTADSARRLNCGGHHTVFGGFAWNGITGAMEVRVRPHVRIAELQVYPDVDDTSIGVRVRYINGTESARRAMLMLVVSPVASEVGNASAVADASAELELECEPGEHEVYQEVRLGPDVELWDEFHPSLYRLEATLRSAEERNTHWDSQSVVFGMRSLSREGTQLAINGHPTFLRGALENFVHPLTGHPPTDVDAWLRILQVNRDHGLNHVRFHTCCPPEAAFVAADRLGIILNVELPGCSGNEPEDEATLEYLQREAHRIIRTFGNHPSFCMLTMGNELLYEGGARDAASQLVLKERVAECRAADPRHWYCCTAHPHTHGRDDDFYVSAWPRDATFEEDGEPIVGIRWSGFDVVDSSRFNTTRPETASDYRDGIDGIERPVITHEVGQWATFPNVNEASRYTGAFRAFNLDIIRRHMSEHQTLDLLDDFVRASGRLSLELYKEEIESALRTPGLAGFQLLGFHDHPPQGTSTVGIVTALRESKGIISSDAFCGFCGSMVPLARLPKRCWLQSETLEAQIDLAHWGEEDLRGAAFRWRLSDASGAAITGEFDHADIARGQLATLGMLRAELSGLQAPAQAVLEVFLPGTDVRNEWSLWVYPPLSAIDEAPRSSARGQIAWSRRWDDALAEEVVNGATAILELTQEQIPFATRGCFTTVFWNPIMKRYQESLTMGILCDPNHPALRSFPTRFHSDWQWWDVLRPSRVLDISDLSPRPEPIVRMIDSFVGNRHLAVGFEARLGRGRLLVTSLDLSTDLTIRHASRQLRRSLVEYAASAEFAPSTVLTTTDVDRLIASHQKQQYRESRDEIVARFDEPVERKP